MYEKHELQNVKKHNLEGEILDNRQNYTRDLNVEKLVTILLVLQAHSKHNEVNINVKTTTKKIVKLLI